MLKTGISILILLSGVLSAAQSDSITKRSGDQLNYKISYISSLIYPGVSTGFEIPISSVRERKLINSTGGKAENKDWFISGNLNWYHHPDFHDNLYLTVEWAKRKTKSTGFISEFSFGPGFSRTFNGGTTYIVSDNGSISVVKSAGYNYALITIGGGIGYDLSVNKQQPFSVFTKANLILMFPYNSTIYFRPALEIGFRFMPDRRKSKVSRHNFSISKE